MGGEAGVYWAARHRGDGGPPCSAWWNGAGPWKRHDIWGMSSHLAVTVRALQGEGSKRDRQPGRKTNAAYAHLRLPQGWAQAEKWWEAIALSCHQNRECCPHPKLPSAVAGLTQLQRAESLRLCLTRVCSEGSMILVSVSKCTKPQSECLALGHWGGQLIWFVLHTSSQNVSNKPCIVAASVCICLLKLIPLTFPHCFVVTFLLGWKRKSDRSPEKTLRRRGQVCGLKEFPSQVTASSTVCAMHVDENLTLRSKFSFEILHVLFLFPSRLFFSLCLLFSLLDLF